MKTTITEDLTISAEFEYDMARKMEGYLDVYTAPKAWREVVRKLDRVQVPLYVVTAYGIHIAGMPFLSERYMLTKDGLELDQNDPSEWTLYTDLDEARKAVAETIVGPNRPRQVSLVTITH